MKTRSEQASSVRRTSQGKSGSSFQQKRAPSFMRGWKICRSGFPVCGGNWQKTRRTLPEMDDLLHVMLSDRSDVPGLSSLSPAPCWPGRCRSWALPDVRCRNCALPELCAAGIGRSRMCAPGCALPDVRSRMCAPGWALPHRRWSLAAADACCHFETVRQADRCNRIDDAEQPSTPGGYLYLHGPEQLIQSHHPGASFLAKTV